MLTWIKRFRAKKTIAKRWLSNTLLPVVLLLILIEVSGIFLIHYYYYNSARQFMYTKLTGVKTLLTRYSSDTTLDFSAEMRKMIESFSDKDK
ncbi:MAG: sensor histidine kinase, partial [Oscillospiraceae bacterium]|nr:sensor histidine kinase [Oscillospiraceae bacterium]